MIGIRAKLIIFMGVVIIVIDAISCLFFFINSKRQQEEALQKLGVSMITLIAQDNEVKHALSSRQPAFLDNPIKRLQAFDREQEIGYWRILNTRKVVAEKLSPWSTIHVDEIPAQNNNQNSFAPLIHRITTSAGETYFNFSVPIFEIQTFSEEEFAAQMLGEDQTSTLTKQKILGFVQIGLSTRKLGEKIHKIILYSIIPMGSGIVLVGLCIILFLTKYIVSPLRNLANITLDIAKGNLDRTVDVQSRDEIGQLAVNFNEMTKELGKTYFDLKQEIVEHKRTEELLQYRVKMEELVATISTNFVTLAPDNVDTGISYTLKLIGEFTGVDRSYVFLFSEDKNKINNTHEWCAETVKSLIENRKEIPLEHFSWAMDELKNFEIIYIPRVTDLPESARAEKEILYSQQVQSLVIMPMVYNSTLVGFLGFDSVRTEKIWTEQDVALLKMVGEIFVNALQRREAEEQIKDNVKRLTILHKIDQAIISSMDLNIILSIFLEQVTTQLSVDAANVLLLNPQTHKLECAASRGFRSHETEFSCTHFTENFASLAMVEKRIIYNSHKSSINDALKNYGEDMEFTTYYGVPLIAKGQVKGVLEIYHRTHINSDNEWMSFLEAIGALAAIAIDNASLFDDMQRSHSELSVAYDSTIEGWSRALELRDKETKGHSQRVTTSTVKLAQIIGVKEEDLIHIRRGALLHDIGKMGIPDNILLKTGGLSEEEWQIMHKHPEYAYQLLAPIAYLRKALDIPYYHHEKWNGTGYPHKLKGEQIPLAARIFAVIDVWDALSYDRPYRNALSKDEVSKYIKAHTGTHFDPGVVEGFLKLFL
ncbi:MAG TPA: HD domain-containing phosphohydrolase [Candidatus Brocadiaceae bacterium]